MALTDWTYSPDKQGKAEDLVDFEYTEAKESYSMEFTPGGGVTRIYYCKYSCLPHFMDDLLGVATINNAGTGISWNGLPDQDKFFKNCFAETAMMDPIGFKGKNDAARLPDYVLAKVTVTYKQVDYAVKTDAEITTEMDRFVTRLGSFESESFTINSTSMRFLSNISSGTHLALSQPPQRMTGMQQWTLLWRNVPARLTNPYIPPNMTAITNCYGKVHAPSGDYTPDAENVFDKGGLAFMPGTVLFLGAEPKMKTNRPMSGDINNNYSWDVALKFVMRDNGLISRTTTDGDVINERAGHNFIWDQNLSQWDLITTNGRLTGSRLFEHADLNSLFTIG